MSYVLEQRKAMVRHYLEAAWECAKESEQDILPDSPADQKHIPSFSNKARVPGTSYIPSQPTQDAMLCPLRLREMIQASLPDLHFTLLELFAEEETVVARWSIQGTDHGGYPGHLPTGRPVSLTGLTLVHMEGQKIVEEYCEINLAEMQRQLGLVVLPTPRITIRQPGPNIYRHETRTEERKGG